MLWSWNLLGTNIVKTNQSMLPIQTSIVSSLKLSPVSYWSSVLIKSVFYNFSCLSLLVCEQVFFHLKTLNIDDFKFLTYRSWLQTFKLTLVFRVQHVMLLKSFSFRILSPHNTKFQVTPSLRVTFASIKGTWHASCYHFRLQHCISMDSFSATI